MMLKWNNDLQIHLYSNHVDMRKQLDGLLMIINEHIPESPKSNTLYLFYNKNMDKLKGILWDNNGFVLIYKRLEKGRFKVSKISKDLQLTTQQLSWLLSGFDFMHLPINTELKYTEYL